VDLLTLSPFLVLTGILLLYRCKRLLEIPIQRLGRARHVCGLDPVHLLGAGDAGDQQHREIAALGRQLLL